MPYTHRQIKAKSPQVSTSIFIINTHEQITTGLNKDCGHHRAIPLVWFYKDFGVGFFFISLNQERR